MNTLECCQARFHTPCFLEWILLKGCNTVCPHCRKGYPASVRIGDTLEYYVGNYFTMLYKYSANKLLNKPFANKLGQTLFSPLSDLALLIHHLIIMCTIVRSTS